MISRENKAIFDEYCFELHNQVSERSYQTSVSHLRSFLEFVGEVPFSDVISVAKSYKAALAKGDLRKDQKTDRVSPEYLRKSLSTVRAFLTWLRDEKSVPVTETWLKRNLSCSTSERNAARWQKSTNDPGLYFVPEEINLIALTPVDSLAEERIRAAIAFLLMSGMRISAFLSLPIKAVNLETRTIMQTLAMGVRTKGNKSGVTKLVPFQEYPALYQVVSNWDRKVRSELSPNAMWFPNIKPLSGELDPSTKTGLMRDSGFRKDMALFLAKAGLSYKSPHKLRHGNIRYLRTRCKDAADLEAVAHNNMQTLQTMFIYATMPEDQALTRMDKICMPQTPQLPTLPSTSLSKDELINLGISYLKMAGVL